MPTCTFLFDHQIIDGNLYPKLRNAVREIVRTNDETEFLFTNAASEALCLAAVLEARQNYPEKRILTTLVERANAAELLAVNDYHTFPCCVIDRILSPPLSVRSPRYLNVAHELLQLWAIDRSDYVISYYYPDLDSRTRVYRHARDADLIFLDLSEPDTVAYIQQEIARLPPDEQKMKTAIQQGMRLKEVGALVGRSTEAVRARHHKIVRKLRIAVQRRAVRPGVAHDASQPVICSLISFDTAAKISPSQIQALAQAMRYLIKRYDVFLFCRAFHVRVSACTGGSRPAKA